MGWLKEVLSRPYWNMHQRLHWIRMATPPKEEPEKFFLSEKRPYRKVTPMTHTNDRLADAMIEAGLPEALVEKARRGYYHDFLSPLAFPELQLAEDLLEVGTVPALSLRQRVINGDFDATTEESDQWAESPEGRAAFKELARDIARKGKNK